MRFLAVWTALTALTLTIISTPGPVEAAVACTVAAGAAAIALRTARVAAAGPRPAAGLPRVLVRLPLAAVRGCGSLLRALARSGPHGKLRRVRLREDADAGWAALALSWSADTCVVDVPEGRREARVHFFGEGHGAPERALARRPGVDGR